MSTAASVAAEFVRLSFAGAEPDPLTNLRLQKLLYYAQGWSFAIRGGANLFAERIEARASGPVVRRAHAALRRSAGSGVIAPKAFAGAPPLDEEEALFVRAVWEAYRPFSATNLSEMTHEEAPWRDAWGGRVGDADSVPMPDEAIADYFARRAVPGPVAEHRKYLREQDHLARERLAAAPPVDFAMFAALAPRPKAARKRRPPAARP